MFNCVDAYYSCLSTRLFPGILSCMKFSGCELFLGNEKLHIIGNKAKKGISKLR